jgi:hypothetical protein
MGSQEVGHGILTRWVFSRRGEGGVWCSGDFVTPMRSEEEAMGPGAWRGARAERGGPVRRDMKEGGARQPVGHVSSGGRQRSGGVAARAR